MDLPWSEEYMLRQSCPLYDASCREDEPGEFLGDDPRYLAEEAEAERRMEWEKEDNYE